MLEAMTFEFRRNHYRSHRGPSDAVMVKMREPSATTSAR